MPKKSYLPHFCAAVVVLVFAFITALSAPRSIHAQGSWLDLPYGFVEEFVATDMKLPTSFSITPDNRIFFAEKAGVIRVWHQGQLLPNPFADMRHEVNSAGDRGLLGIVTHPQFPSQPYVYVAYSYDPPEARGIEPKGARVSRVVRFTANPNDLNRVQPGSQVVLLGKNSTFENIGNPGRGEARPFTCEDEAGTPVQDCLPIEGSAHSVSGLVFGRDGALYVSNGDGINSVFGNVRAQNIDSLAGKILRIDPLTGNGYPNNPFYDGNPASNRSKVYIVGMRNAFRFNIHPSTGELYVGEVGNDNWEEISIGRAGSNFGWPCYEGFDQISTNPVCEPLLSGQVLHTPGHYVYPHENNQGSAIGGDFYRGRTFPPQYHGRYFFGDFNEGSIMYLEPPVPGAPVHYRFTKNLPGPVQIISPPDGNLYILLIGPGKLMRIRYDPAEYASREAGNPHTDPVISPMSGPSYIPPVAPQSVPTPVPVAQAAPQPAQATSQPAQQTAPQSPPQPLQQAAPPAPPTATPTRAPVLTDAITSVNVRPATQRDPDSPIYVSILRPRQELRYKIGDTVRYAGWATDADGKVLDDENLQWTVFMHHNEHTHYDYHWGSGDSGSFEYDDHGDRTYLELCLTATDADDNSNTDCVNIRAREVTYTFDSRPSGQPLIYNGSRYTTPFRVVTYVNAERQLSAPRAPQTGVNFLSWSNLSNGTTSQTVKIGETSQTLAAYYSVPTAVPTQPAPIVPTRAPAPAPQQNAASAAPRTPNYSTASANSPAYSPPAPAQQIAYPTVTPPPFPVGSVRLLLPDQNGSGAGRIKFQWATDITPSRGQAFEVIMWKKGQDPLAEGLGIAAPTTGTEFHVDLNTLDQSLGDLFNAGTYNWTVSLVETSPYKRLKIVAETRQFTYTR